MLNESADTGAADAPEINTAADLADELATDTPDLPAAVEELFEIKVDGVTENVTRAELIKRASHSSGAAKRLTEATREKQAALRLSELLKSDPMKAARELNKDFDERTFLQERLAALMEDDMLSPQERQSRSDMTELQQLRQQVKDAKQAEERQEMDKLVEARKGELDVEIADALKSSGLPKTAAAVKRLASYMLDATEAGLNISADKLAAQVKADMQAEINQLLSVADDDAFEALLGSDLLSKAQRASLKKLKQPGAKVDPSVKAKPSGTPETKPKSKREALDDLGYKDLLF